MTDKKCTHDAPLLNVRNWPGEGIRIGECPLCGSTVTVKEKPKDFPKLAELLLGTIARNRYERLTLRPTVSQIPHVRMELVR